MSSRVWHDETRRLLGVVLARDAEVRAAGGPGGRGGPAGAWLAQHAAERRGDVVRTRLADGRGVLDLDPAALLGPDADRWIAEAGDGRSVRVGLDAAGTVAVGTESWPGDEPRTVAVGRREDDGTDVVVGLWAGTHHEVAARSAVDGGAAVVVRAEYTDEMPGDGLFQVTVAVALAPDGGAVRVLRARLLPSAGPGPGRSRASVVGGTDLLVLDDDGTPVERQIDTTTRWDAAGGARDDQSVGLDPHETDPAVLLEAALPLLDAAGDRATPELWWSARVHGRPDGIADEPPEPDDASDERAAVLLRDLLLRVAGTVDLPAPCAVVVEWGGGHGLHPTPMPELVVLDAAFRDAYRRRPGDHRAAVRSHEALETGEARRIDLAAIADDETLDVWRRYVPAHHASSGTTAERRRAVGARLAAVRRRLLVLLLDAVWPAPWEGPVLPHLRFGPPLHDDGIRGLDPHAELGELWPADVVEALEILWPTRGDTAHGRTTPADHTTPADDVAPPTVLEAAASRDALRRLLVAEGLAAHAEALAAAARWGFALSAVGDDEDSTTGDPTSADEDPTPRDATEDDTNPAPEPAAPATPRSRVGGPPLLPPGTAWPRTGEGEPLTFVASVDLTEVPTIDEPTVLPADGTLLVYLLVGGVDPDEGLLGFVEHEPEDETATVLHVPAGVDPVVVATPEAPLLGDDEERDGPPVHRPFAMRPVLVPPDDWAAANLVGLHPSEQHVYQGIAWSLQAVARGDEDAVMRSSGDGEDWDVEDWDVEGLEGHAEEDEGEAASWADHPWSFGVLLGADAGAQGAGTEDGELVLLSLDGGADLGLDWGDGGDVRLLIREEDARAGRWGRAWATGDSG